MFIISTWDLKAVTPGNSFFKYADDATLVVPASNTSSIAAELANVAGWSALNNQTLNISKTSELIVSLRWTRGLALPPPTGDMIRVTTLLLLGVLLDSHLLFAPHVAKTLAQASQSLHALKVLKTQGCPCAPSPPFAVQRSLPGFSMLLLAGGGTSLKQISSASKLATLRRAVAWGVCSAPPLDFVDLCALADKALFHSVMGNQHHVLRPLLPPLREHTHNLRVRVHPFVIPIRDRFTQVNFVRRMLFAKL